MKPETIIEHKVNGVLFVARADLTGGVDIHTGGTFVWRHPYKLAAAAAAFGAWHAAEIRPQLDSFAGYDAVIFK